jgi:hypothetical protein
MNRKYITPKRMKELQEAINFLDEYVPDEVFIHHVGESLEQEDVELTSLLRELGLINNRRKEIISLLTK